MYSEHFKRLWSNYKLTREDRDRAKREWEIEVEALKRAEAELVDAMLDAGAENFEIDGMTPYISANRECAVNQKNLAEVEEWLEQERGGKENFMRLAVDGSSVKRLVREELKDGADPSSYPPFLKVAVRPRLNVKGWIGGEEGGDES